MIADLRRSLAAVALLSLAMAACGSTNDSAASGAVTRSALAASAANPPRALPIDAPAPHHAAPPAGPSAATGPSAAASSEPLGSDALEQRLNRLEKEIQGSPR